MIVEQIYNASIDKVWNAITEVDQMTQWIFDNISKLYQWKNNIQLEVWGYQGVTHITFELFEQNDHTKLSLKHSVGESFPQDITSIL